MHIWDVNTGHLLLTINGHGAVRGLAVLPGGNLIANGPFAELNLWDVQGRLIRSFPGRTHDAGDVTSIAVLFESVVVAGREEGSLSLWDLNAEKDVVFIPTIRGHEAAVWALASLPNKRFVAADGDGVLKVWRADIPSLALTCLQTLRGHARAAFCLAALPDGRIVSGSMDLTLRFWAPAGYQIDRGAAT